MDLILQSLLLPMPLMFVLGMVATRYGSSLALPEPVHNAMSAYVMLAIGIKGGLEFWSVNWWEMAPLLSVALGVSCLIPIWCAGILHRWCGQDRINSAAIAGHYGSVSAVTFVVANQYLTSLGLIAPGWGAAMLAMLEIPALLVAIASTQTGSQVSNWAHVFNHKTIWLLAGGFLLAVLVPPVHMGLVTPMFVNLLPGILCLFLMTLGSQAAEQIKNNPSLITWRLAVFAAFMPLVHGALGVTLSVIMGLPVASAVVFSVLLASVSYIAAPAVMQVMLPQAQLARYVTMSLGISFPVNLLITVPVVTALCMLLLG